MAVKIRPYHLLCLLTHVGAGHTPEFALKFRDAIQRLLGSIDKEGNVIPPETVQIASGDEDEMCQLRAGGTSTGMSHSENPAIRDQLAAEAITQLLGIPIVPGLQVSLTPQILAKMRQAFANGSIRKACERCEWDVMCTFSAKTGYPQVMMVFPEPDSSESEQ